jgi:RNA polymerase sigma-70 factor, ECF subfamily
MHADNATTPAPVDAEEFERLLATLRPKLHRYCARMVGSVIEAEDVVQETLMKAVEAFPRATAIGNAEAWLFRIAHNASLDVLRQRTRQRIVTGDEDVAMIADPVDDVHQRQAAAAGLRTFMRLSVSERSSVILMDVLGYSLEEIGGVTGSTVPAVKAALHRGRARLRAAAGEPDERPLPVLSEDERTRLLAYVDRFNARDFDAIRDTLADEVRLELVNRIRRSGRTEVANYFHNYSKARDWHLVPGLVDRRPAVLVRDPGDPSAPPAYFILLEWRADALLNIRDFRYARYATDGAELLILD